jgi:hypothetical protein
MKKVTRKEYETPTLTVVSFKTERGYAVSGLQKIWIGSFDDAPAGVEDYTEVRNGDDYYFTWND